MKTLDHLTIEEKRVLQADAVITALKVIEEKDLEGLFARILGLDLPDHVEIDSEKPGEADLNDFLEVTSQFPFMLCDGKIDGKLAIHNRISNEVYLEGEPLFQSAWDAALKCREALKWMEHDGKMRKFNHDSEEGSNKHKELMEIAKEAYGTPKPKSHPLDNLYMFT